MDVAFIGTSDWQNLYSELQRRMGRNLMLFQCIENSLKMVLPCIHPEGSRKNGLDTFLSFRDAIRGRTLGQLVGDYSKSLKKVLSASGAFHIREEGSTVLYKSKGLYIEITGVE